MSTTTIAGVLAIRRGLARPIGSLTQTGTIRLEGTVVRWRNPRAALRAGVATVHQDLGLVECLDLGTNMFLGNLPRSGPFVARHRMHRAAALPWDAEHIRRHADRFSRERFAAEVMQVVDETMAAPPGHRW